MERPYAATGRVTTTSPGHEGEWLALSSRDRPGRQTGACSPVCCLAKRRCGRKKRPLRRPRPGLLGADARDVDAGRGAHVAHDAFDERVEPLGADHVAVRAHLLAHHVVLAAGHALIEL